jgi:Ankyrin repeats (3 copies)
MKQETLEIVEPNTNMPEIISNRAWPKTSTNKKSNKIILYMVIFCLIFFSLTYYTIDIFAPFTQSGAKNYLKGKNIPITKESALKYSKQADYQISNLLVKANTELSTYIVAGSIEANNELYKQFLSKKISITDSLKLDNQTKCSSLLTFLISKNDNELLTHIINKTSIGDVNDCSIKIALKDAKPEIAKLLVDKTDLKNNNKWILSNIKGGDTAVTTVLNQIQTSNQAMLDASISMSHEMHASSDHDQVEFEIVKAVFAKTDQGNQNKYLNSALQQAKFNIAAAIIEAGGDYNTSFIKDSQTYQILDYALEFKNDQLMASIIEKGYKFQNTIKVKTGTSETVENFLYYCFDNKMPKTAQKLIKNGFDLNLDYKPTSQSSENYPLIFAGAFKTEMFDLIPAMLDKEDVLSKLTTEQKEKFLATLLYTFSKNPNKKGIEVIEYLLKTDLNFEAKLLYEPDNSNKYNNYAVPTWATPLVVDIGSYGNLDETKKIYYTGYFATVSSKIKNYDFTKDRQTSIGLAVHKGLELLVSRMLESGLSPEAIDSTDKQEPIIMVAIKKKNVRMIKTIIESKPELNKIYNKTEYNPGDTILMMAISNDQDLNSVKLLVDNGADVNLCTQINKLESVCPISVASSKNSKSEIVEYLKSKGAKCNFASNNICLKSN